MKCIICGHEPCPYCIDSCDVTINDDEICCGGFCTYCLHKKIWVSVGEGWFATADNNGQELGICFYCEEPVGCISEEEFLSLKRSLKNYIETGFPKESN